MRREQRAIFGRWNKCRKCLEECAGDQIRCADGLYKNALAYRSYNNQTQLTSTDLARMHELRDYAEEVKRDVSTFNFGNALRKCRTDVKWLHRGRFKFDPKCIPEDAVTKDEHLKAQEAFTDFVVASLNPKMDVKTGITEVKKVVKREQNPDIDTSNPMQEYDEE